MTEMIDWDVADDSDNIRPSALDLRRKVAERVYHAPFLTPARAAGFLKSPRPIWRQGALEKAELFLGRGFKGLIVEIGAGTAWCSALLSMKPDVERVFALDYDPYSVSEIMPLVFENLGAAEDKISRVLGSFNKLRLDNAVADAVISIGALHHSEAIGVTLREAYRVLKPGGVLVATEHCEPDSLTNREQHEHDHELVDEERANRLYGEGEVKKVRQIDNSDHAYRLVDFLAASLEAGFDAYPYTFQENVPEYMRAKSAEEFDAYFAERVCYNGFEKVVMPPYFADTSRGGPPLYDPLLLICVKPGA